MSSHRPLPKRAGLSQKHRSALVAVLAVPGLLLAPTGATAVGNGATGSAADTLATGVPPAPPQSLIAATTDVVLVGHGWGHGRGMGQWGAYGYAVDHGWTADMILDHYYGGTRAGSIGRPTISVRLSSLDSSTGTWVTSSKNFSVGGYKVSAGSAARVTRSGSSWYVYTSYDGCGARDNFGPHRVADPVFALDSGASASDTIVTCANSRGYRGQLRAVLDGSSVRLVNTLPVEEYLRGVVPRESLASWGDARGGLGMAALEAQAVAARSYAWSENRYSYAKTCDTTSCQVYGGATVGGALATDHRTDAAIAATAGVVRLSSSGAVVRTEFSASTGGYTVGGLWPAVVDLGDSRSPRHTWTARLSGPRLASYYGVGTFVRFSVVSQNGLGIGGGRVDTVRIYGSAGSRDVSANSFVSTWGLLSNWFFPAEQPVQQVNSLRFVRIKYRPEVYRQFSLTANRWTDHGHVSAADYAASGRPSISIMTTAYVKYAWAPAVYGVTDWVTEPQDEVDWITPEEYASVGRPAVRTVPLVPGTVFYKFAAEPAVYALAPDGSVHHLTPAEWVAAGRPAPVVW